jgi:hypothetical protein
MHANSTDKHETTDRQKNAKMLWLLDSFAAARASTHMRDVSARAA